MADEVLLTADDVAERLGIKRDTWHGYVSRGQAPAPDDREPFSGKPLWRESTIAEYEANRPGRGARTDLLRDGD